MAFTKIENDALANTVTWNIASLFTGNSTVNTTITAGSITTSNTIIATGYVVPFTAGESLAALDAVYIEPTLTGGTAGRVYKMDADVLIKSSQAFFAGFALASASAAASVNVQISGIVSGFSGLTVGALYYAGSTAGAVTATKPLHPLPVGIAVSATQILINPGIKREQEQSENVSAVYGYALGGYSGASVATADRITFSTGATAASTVSNLSQARYGVTGVSDGNIYGYALGGYSGAYVTTADRLTFTTSVAVASTISNLSSGRYYSAGVSDGSVYGYSLGGEVTGGGTVATTDRITFSTSVTAASTVSNLSTIRGYAAGVSDGSVYGYAMGGWSTGYVATTDRITFSTSATAASTVSNLSAARGYPAGVSDGSVYGYAMGGWSSASPAYTAITDRITFSTSTTAASTVSNLSVARGYSVGVSDGTVYGYAMGGYSSVAVTTADRLTFSTSATAAYTAANLSQARGYFAGLSDGAV